MDDQHIDNPSVALMQPKETDLNDLIVPGLIGVAGLTLLYFATRSKKSADKNPAGSTAKSPADENVVTFTAGYKKYKIGKKWISKFLEPYLTEQAEENTLATASSGLSGKLLLSSSRDNVIAAFKAIHKADTPDGRTLFDALPAGKAGVESFNEKLYALVEEFQEEY